MTRDEFMKQKSESEQKIMNHVFPVGIVFAVRLGTIGGLIYCGWLQWRFCGANLYSPMLLAIGILVLLFCGSIPAASYCNKRFDQFALKYPFCHCYIMFNLATKTVETGCCYHCGKRVFD